MWRLYRVACECGREDVFGVETVKGALGDLFMGRCPSCLKMGRRQSIVAEAPEGNLAVWGEAES